MQGWLAKIAVQVATNLAVKIAKAIYTAYINKSHQAAELELSALQQHLETVKATHKLNQDICMKSAEKILEIMNTPKIKTEVDDNKTIITNGTVTTTTDTSAGTITMEINP